MDRGVWRATVHGVAKIWTRLSNFHWWGCFVVGANMRAETGRQIKVSGGGISLADQ